jgi:peptidoglycan hydrolase-like protein with peptidoglycan-binding domain
MYRTYPLNRQPYSAPIWTGPEFLEVLKWIDKQPGFRVWEHPQFGGVRAAAHSPQSWHNLKDHHGLGLGADVNYVDPKREKEMITKHITPVLRKLGMAYQFSEYGHVRNHDDHLHIDVGQYTRNGKHAGGLIKVERKVKDVGTVLGLQKRRKPKSVRANVDINTPALTMIVQRIVQRYSPTVRVDGVFGPVTEAAVNKWQRDLGVTADGRVGPNTIRAYMQDYGALRQGSKGHAVRIVQYVGAGAVDGVYGPDTAKRVKEMQAWASLVQTGVFGPVEHKRLIV